MTQAQAEPHAFRVVFRDGAQANGQGGTMATATKRRGGTMTTPPEQEALRQEAINAYLAGLSREQRLCRDLGHIFPDYADEKTTLTPNRKIGANVFTNPCERGCGVKRTRYVSHVDGKLVKANTYDYSEAPGYLMHERSTGFMDADLKGRIRLMNTREREEAIW